MNTTTEMPAQNLQRNDYGLETYISIPLVGILIAILYTALSYFLNYDLILLGFIIAFYLPVWILAKFITKKKRINNFKKIIICTFFTFIFAFGARLITRAVLVYDYELLPQEIAIEKEEGSYVSTKNAIDWTNKFLVEQTGFSSYLGAFIWDAQNTQIVTDNYGTTTTSHPSLTESLLWRAAELFCGLFIVFFALPSDLKRIGLFCDRCGNYKIKKFFLIGKPENFKDIKSALQKKDLNQLQLISKPSEATKSDFVSMSAWICENCQQDAEIDLVLTKKSRSHNILLRIPYTLEEFVSLKKILE